MAVSVVAASHSGVVALAVSQQRFSMCVDALTLRLFNKVGRAADQQQGATLP